MKSCVGLAAFLFHPMPTTVSIKKESIYSSIPQKERFPWLLCSFLATAPFVQTARKILRCAIKRWKQTNGKNHMNEEISLSGISIRLGKENRKEISSEHFFLRPTWSEIPNFGISSSLTASHSLRMSFARSSPKSMSFVCVAFFWARREFTANCRILPRKSIHPSVISSNRCPSPPSSAAAWVETGGSQWGRETEVS